MRRVKNSNGWEEITTVNIDITRIYRNFQTNEDWMRLINKNISKGRKSCKCCGSKWSFTKSDVALAFTSKGNKIICQSCTDYFEDKGIEIFIKPNK